MDWMDLSRCTIETMRQPLISPLERVQPNEVMTIPEVVLSKCQVSQELYFIIRIASGASKTPFNFSLIMNSASQSVFQTPTI